MLRLLRSTTFNVVASAVLIAVVAGLAYAHLGFLGLASVGIVLVFSSVQADLGRETMTGLIAMERMSPAERRARRGEHDELSVLWRAVLALGLVFIVVGGAGFAWLQLPG